MKLRAFTLVALVAVTALLTRAAYSWYFTDNFAGGVVNSTNWQYNVSPNGVGKFAISKLAIPDGTVDHEIRTTLPATCPGNRQYLQFLRTTSNYDDNWLGEGYRIEVRLDLPSCNMILGVNKVTTANGWTQLLYLTNQPFPAGAIWRSFVRNDGPSPGVTVIIGDQQWTLNDTSLTTGKPGIGHTGYPVPTLNSFTELPVSLGVIDRIAPAAPATLTATPNANNIQLNWTAAVDDTNGYGILNYELYRNGTYVGRTTQTSYNFPGLTPSTTYTLGVIAVDGHLNRSTLATLAATTTALISGNSTPRRVGLSNQAATWGGLGWRLLAGALTPVWLDQYTLGYYLFTDSTGAEFKLEVNSGGLWKSKDGSYLTYDPAAGRLWFHSGVFWQMGATSASPEQDAGTLYPTRVQNSNGNYLQLQYAPAVGSSTANTSSRLSSSNDNTGYGYSFTYNTDAIPHLTAVTGPPSAGENRTFTYSSVSLVDPFNSIGYGATTVLQSATQTGTNLVTTLTHNANGELTRVDLPYKGALTWAYSPFTFLGNVTIREVSSRGLIKALGASAVTYNLERNSADSGQYLHTSLTVKDPSTVGAKKWTFSSANDYTRGFVTQLDETADWALATTLRRHIFSYAQDSNTVPYLKATNTTLNPGTANARETRTEQTLDVYGNVTESKVFDFNQLASPVRTTSCEYYWITPGQPNPHYLNRLPKLCYLVGSYTQSLFNITYDSYPSGTLDTVSGTANWHDTANYGTTYTTRGNVTSSYRYGLYAGALKYNLLGEVTQTTDAQSTQTNYSYASGSYFMVPTVMTPNSNANLQTSLSWNSILSPTGSSQPNGSSVTYSYDGNNRVTQQVNADDNVVTYSYNDAANQVTQTVNGRFTRTTTDGLGRTIRLETGDAGGVKTIYDTEYDSCACTPLGKLKRRSLAYAPGGTPLWINFVYDGLGRTLQIQQPNSSGNTTYSYSGNEVTVTDPAGRWKKYTMDALGHLLQVNEPNPAGGADFVTSYQYTLLDQVKLVTMPRATGQGTVTQTRTFNYTGALLTSTTQPENGTKQYFYSVDRVSYTIDAKNQRVDLTYDAYGRVIASTPKDSAGNVVTCDVYSYLYDLSANTYGRLAAIEWGNSDTAICPKGKMREEYTYTAMGRTASKTVKVTRLVGGIEKTADLTVQHSYNNWGAVSQTVYPTTYTSGGTSVPGYLYNYSYDSMGRPSGTTYQVNGAASPQTLVDNVSYNTAGSLTQMRWFNLSGGGSQTETRQYDALGQMTRLTVPGQLDLEYRFSASANDGKAVSQKNYISGEELEYQYDTLGRLSRAETTANSGSAPQWGLSWVYDGFGNRLQQNAVKGTVPTQSILVDPATNRVQSHAFDANGNTTSTPAQGSMTYDVMNRLKTVASDTYDYAPSNQRLWKNNDFVLWGVDGQRLVTAQVAVIGADLRFTQTSFDSYSHGRRLQVSDRLGSVGSYYPYGEAKSGTVSNADSFATYYRDSSALDYAQQRYYQPASGRFLTTDPLQASAKAESPDSWHRYAYALSDPVSQFDPIGLATIMPPACFISGSYITICFASIVSSAGNVYQGSGTSLSYSQAVTAAYTSASALGGWALTEELLNDAAGALAARLTDGSNGSENCWNTAFNIISGVAAPGSLGADNRSGLTVESAGLNRETLKFKLTRSKDQPLKRVQFFDMSKSIYDAGKRAFAKPDIALLPTMEITKSFGDRARTVLIGGHPTGFLQMCSTRLCTPSVLLMKIFRLVSDFL